MEEADYYYDLDTFNACEQNGTLLLTLDAWAEIHPSLITLPVEWDYTVPYGFCTQRSRPRGVPVSPDPDRFSAGIGAGDSDEQKENRKSAFFALPVFRPARRSVTEETCVTLVADRGGRSS